MKPFNIALISVLLLFTACNEQYGEMSAKEKSELKNEIITSYEKHIDDLIRLDYKALMPYYINMKNLFCLVTEVTGVDMKQEMKSGSHSQQMWIPCYPGI